MTKSSIIFSLSLIFLGFIFKSCEKLVYTYDANDPHFTELPLVLEVTDTTAKIYWSTNEACHAKIKYGLSTKYTNTLTVTENRQFHTVILSGLEPYRLYHLRVYIWDFAGNGPIKSEDFTLHTRHNEHSLIREGWSHIEANNLDSAKIYFSMALEYKPTFVEGLSSMGWWYLKTGLLDSSKFYLLKAYNINNLSLLTLLGLGNVALIENNVSLAIYYLNNIISIDADWQFPYYAPFNSKRVHLQLAEAYINVGQYNKAQQELDIVWPKNGLNPDIPTSWKVNGVKYSSYIEALFAAIQYCLGRFAKIVA